MKIVRERAIVAVLTAVQFVDVVDFTMVLPLGPDFAAALGMPSAAVGYVAAAYTTAAAVAGVLGVRRLDRFDRRRALTVAMLGLSLATFAGALCRGVTSLVIARAVAGLFGGPAVALVQSTLADVVPESRRGRAMAVVLGANAVAAIAGVPAGLALAEVGGWWLPFVATGALGLAVVCAVGLVLPAMPPPARVEPGRALGSWRELARRRELRLSALMMFAAVASSYLLIPNLSAYVQQNRGLARAALPEIYAIGGLAALVSMQICGALVDRLGALPIVAVASLGFVATVAAFIVVPQPGFSATAAFVLLLISLAGRNVASRTLATTIPGPHERAGLLSSLTAVHQTAASCGALLSARILRDDPSGALIGMPTVGALAIGLALIVPIAVALLERTHSG